MFLKGKTALVTGSTSGIGLAYAKALAAEGAQVMINGFGDAAAIEKERAGLEATSGKALYSDADMTKPDAIHAMVRRCHDELGGPDIVIANAGVQHVEPIDTFPVAKWDQIIAINLSSAFHLMQAAIPFMKEKKWGRIITSTSSGVISPIPNLGISNALRLSLVGWSKTLAREVGGDGITANIVLPGRIATDRIKFLDEAKAKREGRSVEQVSSESTTSIPASCRRSTIVLTSARTAPAPAS